MQHRAETERSGRGPRAPKTDRCHRGHVKDYVASDGTRRCRECSKLAGRTYTEKRRQKRLEARRARLEARAVPPEADRVWAAGHFEGEGTLTINAGGRRRLSTPRVSLVSTDRQVIRFFHATWPGYVHSLMPKSASGRSRKAYVWVLRSCDAIEAFLLDTGPHFRTLRVRTKADLLLEDVRDRAERRFDDAARRRKLERMTVMRVLNRRGRDRSSAEEPW